MSRRTPAIRWSLVMVCVSGLMTAGATARDWPRYRRDAARSGAVEEALSAMLKLIRVEVG